MWYFSIDFQLISPSLGWRLIFEFSTRVHSWIYMDGIQGEIPTISLDCHTSSCINYISFYHVPVLWVKWHEVESGEQIEHTRHLALGGLCGKYFPQTPLGINSSSSKVRGDTFSSFLHKCQQHSYTHTCRDGVKNYLSPNIRPPKPENSPLLGENMG